MNKLRELLNTLRAAEARGEIVPQLQVIKVLEIIDAVGRRTTQDERQRVRKLRDRGHAIHEIAVETGMHPARVKMILGIEVIA